MGLKGRLANARSFPRSKMGPFLEGSTLCPLCSPPPASPVPAASAIPGAPKQHGDPTEFWGGGSRLQAGTRRQVGAASSGPHAHHPESSKPYTSSAPGCVVALGTTWWPVASCPGCLVVLLRHDLHTVTSADLKR